jgi:hypothetical protein
MLHAYWFGWKFRILISLSTNENLWKKNLLHLAKYEWFFSKIQFEMKKLVSAIPVGLKCETRNSCACRPLTTMSVISMMLLLHCPARKWSHWVQYLSRLWWFTTMSVTSVTALLRCLSRLWCLNYAVCHVCDALTTLSVTFIRSLSTMSVTFIRSLSTMSVTFVEGTGGGCKFLPLNFNTSFQFVFHKRL